MTSLNSAQTERLGNRREVSSPACFRARRPESRSDAQRWDCYATADTPTWDRHRPRAAALPGTPAAGITHRTGDELQSPESVAHHYESLSELHLEAWGEHVDHGPWLDGRESPDEVVLQLIGPVAEEACIGEGGRVCDVGCGCGGIDREARLPSMGSEERPPAALRRRWHEGRRGAGRQRKGQEDLASVHCPNLEGLGTESSYRRSLLRSSNQDREFAKNPPLSLGSLRDEVCAVRHLHCRQGVSAWQRPKSVTPRTQRTTRNHQF
jgi:hypothetical protein